MNDIYEYIRGIDEFKTTFNHEEEVIDRELEIIQEFMITIQFKEEMLTNIDAY